MAGTKGMKMPRGDKNSILDFEVVVPKSQQIIMSVIESYERKIADAKVVIAIYSERKRLIMNKWLK